MSGLDQIEGALNTAIKGVQKFRDDFYGPNKPEGQHVDKRKP